MLLHSPGPDLPNVASGVQWTPPTVQGDARASRVVCELLTGSDSLMARSTQRTPSPALTRRVDGRSALPADCTVHPCDISVGDREATGVQTPTGTPTGGSLPVRSPSMLTQNGRSWDVLGGRYGRCGVSGLGRIICIGMTSP